jgi:hypothetical protein
LALTCRRLLASVSDVDLVVSIPDDLRDRMRKRLMELNGIFTPAKSEPNGKSRIRAAIAMTLSGWLNGKTENPKVHVDLLVEALSDLPVWAVEAACRDLMQGRVPHCNVDFAPSSARMHAHARSIMTHLEQEQANLSRVLAKNDTPRAAPLRPMSEKTQKNLKDLADMLRNKDTGPSPATLKHREQIKDAEHRHMLREYKGVSGGPVFAGGLLISPSLLKTLPAGGHGVKKD